MVHVCKTEIFTYWIFWQFQIIHQCTMLVTDIHIRWFLIRKQIFQWNFRRYDHSDSIVIQWINKSNKSSSCWFFLEVQLGNITNNYCMEILCELYVITGCKITTTNFIKRCVKNLSASLFESYVSAEMSKRFWPNNIIFLTTQNLENCINFTIWVWIRISKKI